MAADLRRRRRITTIASAVAAVALTVGLATGCDPDDPDALGDSLDCARTYDDFVDGLRAIHETPDSQQLDEIEVRTDDSEVGKAVRDLNKAIADYNKAVLHGEHPDSDAIDKAADEFKDVCS
ncbi:hypothetical protein ACIQI8_17760 [Streptomyces sp. NPDC092369]|uniref:hypothetical protein n=1 Tax=Streptomyces sp. NPDC092369 TaxID=3366015 RepID=UPI0037FCEB33